MDEVFWDTPVARWSRRSKLCIGYKVSYDDDTSLHIVDVYAVQNDRTPAHLGRITLAREEWNVFHGLVYRKWEDLDPNEEENED